MNPSLVVVAAFAVFAIVIVSKGIRIVRQERIGGVHHRNAEEMVRLAPAVGAQIGADDRMTQR